MEIPNLQLRKTRGLKGKRKAFEQDHQEIMEKEEEEATMEEYGRGTFLIPPLPGTASPNKKYKPIVYDMRSYEIQGKLKHHFPTVCTTYKAIFTDDQERKSCNVVIKVLDKQVQKIELDVASPVEHPSVLPQIYIELEEYKLVLVVMPYMELGSARDLLSLFPFGMPEPFIALLLKQVLLGIRALHAQAYFHKHVKPSNILITDQPKPSIQLSSNYYAPNLSSLHPTSDTETTPYHIPPELQNTHTIFYSQCHSHKFCISDIWSVGVTALELALGQQPISQKVASSSIYNRVSEIGHNNEVKEFSQNFKEFVSFCLAENPQDRLLASELLKLSFFQSDNTSSMEEFLEKIAQLKLAKKEKRVVNWGLDSKSLKLHPVFARDWYILSQF